jgi:hypothetical protein
VKLQQALLLLLAVAAGLVLGFIAIHYLAPIAWGNVLIWGVACVGLGLAPGTQVSKAIRLRAFGFTVGFAFMCFGYGGADPLVTKLPAFALIALFCAVCAIAAGAIVHFVKGRLSKA